MEEGGCSEGFRRICPKVVCLYLLPDYVLVGIQRAIHLATCSPVLMKDGSVIACKDD